MRKKGSIKKDKSLAGVTLVEIMVSVAILAIVTTPFLGSFLTAATNNALTTRKTAASNIAQKAMDEIKADPSRLDEKGWTIFESFWTAEENIINYEIEYRVAEDTVTTQTDSFIPPSDTEFHIKLNVLEDSFSESGFLYPLEDSHEIELTSNGMLVDYSLNGVVKTIVPTDNAVNLEIRFSENHEDDADLMLQINIDDALDEAINLYVINDAFYRLKLQTSGNSLNIIRGISSDETVYTTKNNLYDLDVRVTHIDGKTSVEYSSKVKK